MIDGAAHAAAPAVQPELRLAHGEPEILVGGEHGVLHEVVDLAVQAVGARLQAHVDRRAAHESGAGVEAGGLHLELFHHAGRRRSRPPASPACWARRPS